MSKRKQILVTAKELFWKHGIKRVTVEEICSRASVSKMTFYKHFSNKNDLVKHILDNLYSESMKKYSNIMSSEKKYKDKVAGLYRLKLEATDAISHEFLNDFYDSGDEELKEYLNKKVEENLNPIIKDLRNAQDKGKIRKDIKPEFINFFLNHMVKLVNDPALNSLYPSAQEMILELTNFFFYGILPPGEKYDNEKER
ncbi:MAG: TetR/AcrR family transcriptional regulator [Bacteroidota bacterium]|nr:TetR/AcrR family transcriptional regulator [Bacteroidota bacterium]